MQFYSHLDEWLHYYSLLLIEYETGMFFSCFLFVCLSVCCIICSVLSALISRAFHFHSYYLYTEKHACCRQPNKLCLFSLESSKNDFEGLHINFSSIE